MGTFAPLPVDLFSDANNFLDENSSAYFSLSQFDLELQQQAQAALLQVESWQDFDKYLPIDNQLFNNNLRNEQNFINNTRNVQAQPIFTNYNNSGYTDPSLLYEPVLLPTQPSPTKEKKTVQQVKQEYASPESLPHSPPQKETLSPLTNTTTTPSTDFLNWNTLDTQGKVPIQRLKSNSIITNAVNAALNNTTSTGRQHKKTAHNAIERRYRNNINDRITELKNAVPALLYAKVKDTRTGKRSQRDDDEEEGEDGEEFLDGVAVATKLNKATILKKATEYINHLKKTGDDVRRENETLQHILTQLPGGTDILQRYYLQKQQRDKEAQQVQMREREARKVEEQRRKVARKRAKYSSSESSPDPTTPPAMSNRIFMALFMGITFFSTAPGQYSNYHHPSQPSERTYSNTHHFLNSFFNFDDTWSFLRTLIFIICIGQLLFPYIKYMCFGSMKVKRVHRTKRMIEEDDDFSD